MMWMDQGQAKLGKAWGVLPCRGVWCKLRQSGWLLCPDGTLQAVFSGSHAPVLSITGYAGIVEQSFAGGLRPGGAGRLTGVLHYFTRGPNKQN